jgi:hypothetical protein
MVQLPADTEHIEGGKNVNVPRAVDLSGEKEKAA